MYSDFMLSGQFEDDTLEDLETLEGQFLITSTLEYQKQLSEGCVPVERKEPVRVDVDQRRKAERSETLGGN